MFAFQDLIFLQDPRKLFSIHIKSFNDSPAFRTFIYRKRLEKCTRPMFATNVVSLLSAVLSKQEWASSICEFFGL